MKKTVITIGFLNGIENMKKITDLFNIEYIEFMENWDLGVLEDNYSDEFYILIRLSNLALDKQAEIFKLTAELNVRENVEVLFAVNDINQEQRVRWLSLGALNYFFEPFKAEEVCHFINLISKKSQITDKSNDKFWVVDDLLKINLKNYEVYYLGTKANLDKSSTSVLLYLMSKSGATVSREELINEAITSTECSSRNVDTYIKKIRKETCYDIIQTVRGVGYMYNSQT